MYVCDGDLLSDLDLVEFVGLEVWLSDEEVSASASDDDDDDDEEEAATNEEVMLMCERYDDV